MAIFCDYWSNQFISGYLRKCACGNETSYFLFEIVFESYYHDIVILFNIIHVLILLARKYFIFSQYLQVINPFFSSIYINAHLERSV